jgi:hypothetical protein
MNKPKADRSKIKDKNMGISISEMAKARAQRVADAEEITLAELGRKAIREYCDRYDEKKGVKVNG